MSYGFIECRTDDEKYVLTTLIIGNKPDKNWCSLTIYNENGEELANWDNSDYLRNTLFKVLVQVYDDDITMKQFRKILNEIEKTSEELFPTKKNVCELYELFQWAKKLKMM